MGYRDKNSEVTEIELFGSSDLMFWSQKQPKYVG